MLRRVVAVAFTVGFCVWPLCSGHATSTLPPAQALVATADPENPAWSRAEPFGLDTEWIGAAPLADQWQGVKTAIRADNQILALCRAGASCPEAARRFLAIIDEGRARDGRARIGIINRAINLAITPMSDLLQWGVPDRWSAPLETFTTGHGDCEDYAIAKYVALQAAGIAADDLKIVIVWNMIARENHAVAAVRLEGEWVILDNRSLALIPDGEVREEIPMFLLDENGVRVMLSDRLRVLAAPVAGFPSQPGPGTVPRR
jgi:predicted transglutaminase-like cysteine proteinase